MNTYRSTGKPSAGFLVICLLAFLSLGPVSVYGADPYTIETVPNVRLADRTNHVSNPDGIISAQDIAEINRLLNGLEDSLSIEVAVVALNSTGEEDARTFATELFNRWGLGKKGKDNGLLILLVTDQRSVVFETGYGLEGVLPDAISHRIQQQYMISDLKAGRYSTGMLAGVEGVTDYLLNSDYGGESAGGAVPHTRTNDLRGLLKVYLALTFLVTLWFMWRISTIRRRNPEYNAIEVLRKADSTFRELGCITLVLFLPGIILLGIWYFFYRQVLLRRARTCPNCGRKHFRRLSPEEGAPLLDAREQMENRLESVDHTVYRCDDCHYVYKDAVDIPGSPYNRCPRCGTKALICDDTHIIQQPTYRANGLAEENCVCKMCNYTDRHKKILKPLRRNTTAGGIGGAIGGMIGGGFFGGGLGGGGFGGGIGGGSWGGGASGGGGAIGRF